VSAELTGRRRAANKRLQDLRVVQSAPAATPLPRDRLPEDGSLVYPDEVWRPHREATQIATVEAKGRIAA